ncbi:MAG: serine kinase [Chloroflexi bacterium]|nr:serine kinase [Chloroflexota bacterium]
MPASSSENREELAGFDLLLGGFQRACDAVGGSLDQYIKIGEFTVCLRFAGDGLRPYISPALAHLCIAPTPVPDLTICLWDTVSTNTPPAPLLTWLCQSIRMRPLEHLSPRQEIRTLSNARVPAAFEMGAGVLSMLDTQQGIAVYWVHDATALPYYEQGAPLRTILNWWLSGHNFQCVHAGAVGTAEGGVLLTGKGGSGKSTTALACLASELLYVSDDYCLFTNEPRPYVYSLYNTAKLNGLRDLQRQPQFLPMIHNADQLGQEKLMMFLARHMAHKLRPGFPLKAILLPCVTGNVATKLTPITAGLALRALAPTSLFQLPGSAQRSFLHMGQLVRQLPCYQLELGSDLSAIPDTILRLLAAGGGSGDA